MVDHFIDATPELGEAGVADPRIAQHPQPGRRTGGPEAADLPPNAMEIQMLRGMNDQMKAVAMIASSASASTSPSGR